MVARGLVILLFAAALIVQGLAAVVPHSNHGPASPDGASVDRPGLPAEPHHCLACSVQAPVAAPATGVSMSALPAVSTPLVLAGTPLGVTVPIKSTGPRGPPPAS